MIVRAETRVFIYCSLRSAQDVFCRLVQKGITLEKGTKNGVIWRTPKGYISHIWGEAPSKPIVTKCGLWVPFLAVINILMPNFIVLVLIVFGRRGLL